jgi:acetylornithine/N-succinyldiaminopimelate aminotransferase
LTVGAGDNVVRLLPPLIIGDAEIQEAYRRLDATCSALRAAQVPAKAS